MASKQPTSTSPTRAETPLPSYICARFGYVLRSRSSIARARRYAPRLKIVTCRTGGAFIGSFDEDSRAISRSPIVANGLIRRRNAGDREPTSARIPVPFLLVLIGSPD